MHGQHTQSHGVLIDALQPADTAVCIPPWPPTLPGHYKTTQNVHDTHLVVACVAATPSSPSSSPPPPFVPLPLLCGAVSTTQVSAAEYALLLATFVSIMELELEMGVAAGILLCTIYFAVTYARVRSGGVR